MKNLINNSENFLSQFSTEVKNLKEKCLNNWFVKSTFLMNEETTNVEMFRKLARLECETYLQTISNDLFMKIYAVMTTSHLDWSDESEINQLINRIK